MNVELELFAARGEALKLQADLAMKEAGKIRGCVPHFMTWTFSTSWRAGQKLFGATRLRGVNRDVVELHANPPANCSRSFISRRASDHTACSDDMVARGARTGRKSLKRELAVIKAEEQRASTWLVRISLFLLVLGWAYSEYASNTSTTPRTRTAGASARKKQAATAGGTVDLKPILLATGAA